MNKYIPPYAIVAGVPAKVLKYRFTPEQIIEHESILYSEIERYTREELERIFAETKTREK